MKVDLSIGNEITSLESSQNNMNDILFPNQGSEATQLLLGDPHISQTMGMRKKKITQNSRFMSGLEVSLDKFMVKRKACHEC